MENIQINNFFSVFEYVPNITKQLLPAVHGQSIRNRGEWYLCRYNVETMGHKIKAGSLVLFDRQKKNIAYVIEPKTPIND